MKCSGAEKYTSKEVRNTITSKGHKVHPDYSYKLLRTLLPNIEILVIHSKNSKTFLISSFLPNY